jgi:hypothetical protein
MPSKAPTIELSLSELRELTGYAAECARRALPLFEKHLPHDTRPREAIEAAYAFAKGKRRSNDLRQGAWAALRAAKEATDLAAREAARAACQAAGTAFLHPIADAHQVKHLFGSAAYLAHAEELAFSHLPQAAEECLVWARQQAPAVVRVALARYPVAPAGGGRVGALIRALDAALRAS